MQGYDRGESGREWIGQAAFAGVDRRGGSRGGECDQNRSGRCQSVACGCGEGEGDGEHDENDR